MQDFGDCIQSSQIGPHRVQLPSASPIAITPPSNTNLRNMDAPTTDEGQLGAKTGAFSSRARRLQRRASASDSSARAPECNARAMGLTGQPPKLHYATKQKRNRNDFGDELERMDAA